MKYEILRVVEQVNAEILQKNPQKMLGKAQVASVAREAVTVVQSVKDTSPEL